MNERDSLVKSRRGITVGFFLSLGFVLGLLLTGAVHGQDLGDDEIPPGIVINDSFSVEMVLTPVTVRSKGEFVAGLEDKRFTLFVDDIEIPIESFESGPTAPLSLIVLQDLSGSMENLGKLDTSRRAIEHFFDRSLPADEFALASFAGGTTEVEVPFTEDMEALRESIGLWQGWGTTALYDAVAWLPQLSVAGRRARRAAILITDGVDNDSAIPPQEAGEIVRRAKLPVYVLGLESHVDRNPYDDTFRYDDLLRLLARASGGRYYSIHQTEEVDAACAAILAELRHQYVLGFSASGVDPEAYHDIRVEVRHRGEPRIEHRPGYQGSSPAATAGH
jgi:VWFA-related protein